MVELGYWGLFLACFLAATVLPFSSEAVLSGVIIAGGDPVLSLVIATIANWLGGMTSYGLGRLGNQDWITRFLRVSPSKIEQMNGYLNNRIGWASLLCWLPFVGDVIAVALGLMRANVWVVTIGMFIGKAVIYCLGCSHAWDY